LKVGGKGKGKGALAKEKGEEEPERAICKEIRKARPATAKYLANSGLMEMAIASGAITAATVTKGRKGERRTEIPP
jgi:hypothetical protein